jgi:Asp-tRNA(Asn)/Glu-tRNA(Gln) amidotransferase A subunit family amidase
LTRRRRESSGGAGQRDRGSSATRARRTQQQQQQGQKAPAKASASGKKDPSSSSAVRRKRKPAPAPPPPPPPPVLALSLPLAATPFVSPPSPQQPQEQDASAAAPKPPLDGARIAVSEQVPLRGAHTGAGGGGLLSAATAATEQSAPFVARLVEQGGARVVLHASSQPLNALFLPRGSGGGAGKEGDEDASKAQADPKEQQHQKQIAAWARDGAAAPALGANILNPSAPWRASGGGSTAAAAAVAAGKADLAAASDWLGEARVPAACMGLHAFVPTTPAGGAASAGWRRAQQTADDDDGAASSILSATLARGSGAAAAVADSDDSAAAAGLEAPALVARDVAALAAAANVLDLPGRAGDLKHTLTQLVVADDLFELCEPSLLPAHAASRAAALRWASAAQAGSVRLIPFLAQGVAEDVIEGLLKDPHARAAARGVEVGDGKEDEDEEEDEDEDDKKEQPPAPPVNRPVARPAPRLLRALHSAACVLRRADLAARYGDVVLGASDDDDSPPLPAPLLAEVRAGRALPASTISLARRAAADVAETLRSGVKPDVVVLLPALPGPPPRLDCSPRDARRFALLSARLLSIPALAGCPTVWLPSGHLAQGARELPPPPLSVALMGAPRADRRVLAVAGAMRRFLDAAAEEVAAKAAQAAKAGREAVAGAAGGGSAEGKGKGNGKGAAAGGGGGGRAATTPAPAPPPATATAAPSSSPSSPPPPLPQLDDHAAVDRAERHKLRGNALFGQGKFAEAALEYTRAIAALGPEALRYRIIWPSLYNNRAMAHLRAFNFEQAERDCDAALDCAVATTSDLVKALLRRGTARAHLYRPEEAAEDFAAVLKLEPNNRQAREELRLLRQQERKAAAEAARSFGADGPGFGGGAGGGGSGGGAGGAGDMMQGLEMDPQELLADMLGRPPAGGGGGGAGAMRGGGRAGGGGAGGGGGDTLVLGPGGMPVLMRADGTAVPLGQEQAAELLGAGGEDHGGRGRRCG